MYAYLHTNARYRHMQYTHICGCCLICSTPGFGLPWFQVFVPAPLGWKHPDSVCWKRQVLADPAGSCCRLFWSFWASWLLTPSRCHLWTDCHSQRHCLFQSPPHWGPLLHHLRCYWIRLCHRHCSIHWGFYLHLQWARKCKFNVNCCNEHISAANWVLNENAGKSKMLEKNFFLPAGKKIFPRYFFPRCKEYLTHR